jgi:hypothetical protein
LILEKPK